MRTVKLKERADPEELNVTVLKKQMAAGAVDRRWEIGDRGSEKAKSGNRKAEKSDGVDPRICNFGGGVGNSCSLRQLSEWCEKRFGPRKVESDPKPRPYDLPWVVLDSTRAKEVVGLVLGWLFHKGDCQGLQLQ